MARAPQTPEAFCRALRRYLASEASYLDTSLEGTWCAGGCWILAEALATWIGPAASLEALWGVWSDGHADDGVARVQHVVARVGARYLDGDGCATRATLLRRWRTRESVLGATLAPMNGRAVESAHAGTIPRAPRIVARLVRQLEARFGAASDWGLGARPNPAQRGRAMATKRRAKKSAAPAAMSLTDVLEHVRAIMPDSARADLMRAVGGPAIVVERGTRTLFVERTRHGARVFLPSGNPVDVRTSTDAVVLIAEFLGVKP